MSRFRPGRCSAYAALVLWSLVCAFPVYWVGIASLKGEDAIIHGPRYLPFVDFTPSLAAWRFILFDSTENLLRPLWNSFVSSFGGTLLAVTAACLLLYAVTRLHQKRWLLRAVLASRLLVPISLAIPLYIMAQKSNLLDTKLALTLTYGAINVPVALWLLMPIFGTRASEQEEAAILEGASHLHVLWEIVLPMLSRGVAAVALIVFVLCWNEYLFAAFLTTDQASTLTPWMVGQLSLKEAQVGGEPEEWAHLSAATMLMIAPLLLFTGVAMRMISRTAQCN